MNRAIALACVLLLTACSSDSVTVQKAWVRAPLPGRSMTAGYFELHNQTKRPVIVTGASADGFGAVSIHETRLDEAGISRMVGVEQLELAPDERVEFAPGGLHLMLMRPQREFTKGEIVPVTLLFADGATLHVSATVREDAP
ncbi:MAG: copper chaperone PCu(A)C [Gammaproteobacteria bacterium]|nr:copper chaperone PCu(A)C [Gammaproteobacteria bacterium]NNF59988.1 copper chaperone PCu(A)C [Gammaproteobacteria bacterium]NNM21452.1 copper chaperone PCu(A)C [Gammaproteobacteria bacterium]